MAVGLRFETAAIAAEMTEEPANFVTFYLYYFFLLLLLLLLRFCFACEFQTHRINYESKEVTETQSRRIKTLFFSMQSN